jgi:ParD-like antitoxin of type II ParDE toxin-antitoxin system
MSSNSIRVNAELFEQAREAGEILSRSAAQQIEHWAKIGAALEDAGLTVTQATELLTVRDRVKTGTQAEAALWTDKRARQSRDRQTVRSGKIKSHQLSWFAGRTKRAQLIDSAL